MKPGVLPISTKKCIDSEKRGGRKDGRAKHEFFKRKVGFIFG